MRSHRLWRALSERRGEGYVDVIVLVLCAVMVLALAMRVLPVFIQKQQLDTFATELVREAEVSGRVGAETSRRAAVLSEKTGLHPDILWSSHGRIQLNEEVTVTLTMDTNIGLFGEFASFPVTQSFEKLFDKTFRQSWKISSLLEMRWRDCGNG